MWSPTEIGVLFAGGLFVGMLVMLEIGRRLGSRRLADDPEKARAGVGALEGAVFGLLGLLIAFTFSGAAARFDDRRHMVTEEANDIGTAWLRIDLLPAEAQPELRDLFRTYLDSRLKTYAVLPDVRAAEAELARSVELQGKIWTRAVAAVRGAPPGPSGTALLTALNSMFDIVTTRTVATRIHPPSVIFVMLALLALISALFAGNAMAEARTRSWMHLLGYSVVLALTVYVILDLEHPRLGLIQVKDADRVLIDLRQSLGPIGGR